MKLLLLFLASVCASAQIEQPRIGMRLDANGSVRPVLGIAGSATLGDPVWSGVLSMACSAKLCLAKTETALVSSSGESVDTPPGAALIAIKDDSAYVYFLETRQFMRWHDGRLDPLDFSPEGDVVSLQATADGFTYAVHDDATNAAAVLLIDGGRLEASADQVRVLRADGSERDFAISGVQGFVRMSDSYVELITANGMWALCIEPDKEQLFLLPGVSQ
jgi:hypothetical protein